MEATVACRGSVECSDEAAEGKGGEREMATRVVQASEQSFQDGVASKDVQLSDSVWVRMFLPQLEAEEEEEGEEDGEGAEGKLKGKGKKKALVLYAHGGAYASGEPHWEPFHSFCCAACKSTRSIWISLSYRLAPCHRLPAPYDDARLALLWLRDQALHHSSASPSHPWLSPHLADFSAVFLAGESAGANIMIQMAMDMASSDLHPLRIRGLLLIQPGFHSEEKRAKKVLDAESEERYNRALPEGETMDYPPVNPIHDLAPPLTPLSAYPHIFINAAEGDFRYDMTIRFYDIVRDFCPHVQLFISPGKEHTFHLNQLHCPEAQELHAELAGFMHTCVNS